MSAAAKKERRQKEDDSMYIVELPGNVRRELCEDLDARNVWRKLAEDVQLNSEDVQSIQWMETLSRGSPSDEFLHIWGVQYNHTMRSLFALMFNKKLRNAMLIIKDNVPVKYHDYIDKCEETVSETSESMNTEIVYECAQKLVKIDYDKLVEATGNWNPKNKLGRGGFGEVYKGELSDTEVAIKAISYKPESADKRKIELRQSFNEINCLNTLRHDNLLALYGCSLNGKKICLVYQLMKGGSLESRLRANNPRHCLTWQQRLSIALGTAKGINYLHTAQQTPFIHGDIKPANILLDQSLQPKIGDFGLAREGPNSISGIIKVDHIIGTRIYLAPEFIRSKEFSTGVDIYSFGVVLLEIFSGRLMSECTSQEKQPILLRYLQEKCRESFKNRGEILDNKLETPIGVELDKCICAIEFGLKCAAFDLEKRPTMKEVVTSFKTFSSD